MGQEVAARAEDEFVAEELAERRRGQREVGGRPLGSFLGEDQGQQGGHESAQEPAAKPASACVELDPEDEASSVESAADEWDTPELLVAQAELANAWDCVDKPGKFALEHLVALMDNVPRKVLEVWGLLKVQGTLKGMRHLPRREKVKEILGALQEAVDAAVVKPETPPQSPLFEG